jgi:hypothetical protein
MGSTPMFDTHLALILVIGAIPDVAVPDRFSRLGVAVVVRGLALKVA